MVPGDTDPDVVSDALSGGDVASVIVSPFGSASANGKPERMDAGAFASAAAELVPLAQRMGAAAVVAFDPALAARTGADAVHLDAPVAAGEVKRLAGTMGVGVGNLVDRHGALTAGEAGPDYAFFGRLHRDIRAEPHPLNLDLAAWWSQVVTVPCVVPGGSAVECVVAVAKAGADFVALQSAIFDASDPARAVARANALLDEHAPRFEE